MKEGIEVKKEFPLVPFKICKKNSGGGPSSQLIWKQGNYFIKAVRLSSHSDMVIAAKPCIRLKDPDRRSLTISLGQLGCYFKFESWVYGWSLSWS